MNSSEFVNINNNEVSINAREDCTNNDEDCANQTQNVKTIANNGKLNSNLTAIEKVSDSQNKLFGNSKNRSSAIENKSNILSVKEISSSVLIENVSLDTKMDVESQDACRDIERVTNETIRSAEEETSNEGNPSITTSLNSSQDKFLPCIAKQDKKHINANEELSQLDVQQDKPSALNYNFNIVPNPNEFNLVGNNNLSLPNPEILDLNRSTDELLAFSDNSIVISNSNAIPQSDSIVSSNYSLSQLQQYASDDDEDSVIEELPVATQQYRGGGREMEDSDDSDSTTSSSTSILISETSSDSESENDYEDFSNKPECPKPIKAKGEMDLCDLPPIEDLTITVPEEECLPIGKIYQIVDQLVIVQANKDTPAYDLDTVLFTQGGRPLGKVFDVMGPVTEPYYCIRFNSKDHIKEQNLTLDQTVYAAPKTQYSKFVFLAQLMQLKGSDASWENDVEPPEIYLDYSDDEQEQRAKKKYHRNKKATKTDSDPDEPARKRHSAYVKRMNARNLRLTAARGNLNPSKNGAEKKNNPWQPTGPIGASQSPSRAAAPCHQMFGRPPLFDFRVPPSNLAFPNPGGPQFSRNEFSGFPQMFASPSSSSRPQGFPPFPQRCSTPIGRGYSRPSGPPPFPQHCTPPGPLPFPQQCSTPAPMPFPGPSPGPPGFSGRCASPGSPGFPRSCSSSGPSPFPRPGASPGSSPFPRGPASSGPPGSPRTGTFSPSLPYGRLPSNRGPVPGWDSSFPQSDNPWASAFPPAPPRNTPPPRLGSFPFSMDFPGSYPVRSSPPPPHGPPSGWPIRPNNRGNSPRYSFNPSVPPPSQD